VAESSDRYTWSSGATGSAVETAFETRRLTKRYGAEVGIEDLDLLVRRGEVFGFLGPNGAGKTTTIRMLLGLLRPTGGSATVLGLDLRREGRRIRAETGYVPGDLALYEHLRAEDLLTYFARLRGGVEKGRVMDLADRFHLDLRRRVRELSRGNRQKLAVMQAFMHDPRLLVLDEPTTGLDPLVQIEFQQLVREVVAAGATVFLSSHVLAEVEQMADRVGIVNDGRLIVVDTVDGLREKAMRRVEIDFPGAPPHGLALVPGVHVIRVHGGTALCEVTGRLTTLLDFAAAQHVLDIHTHDPDLEEAFLGYVAGNGGGGAEVAQPATR
jgi:ABC-2 type transport system ATP-binding protein